MLPQQIAAVVAGEVAQFRSASPVPGLAVGVVVPTPGNPSQLMQLTYSFGVGNLATGAAVTAQTQFEIGSETKLFTAALLANSVSGNGAGKPLALSDSIGPLLPAVSSLPAKVGPITLAELATHRSGLPDDPLCPPGTPGYWPPPNNGARAHYTPSDLMFALTSSQCNQGTAQPGTQWLYSDFGFGLLGQIVAQHENASHPDYFNLVSEQITRPLGMTATGAEPTTATLSLAQPYDKTGAPAPLWDNTGAMAGGGGLISSIADMTRFVAAQLGSGPPDVVKMLRATQAPQAPGGNAHMTMGLAWQIVNDLASTNSVLTKNGGTAGSSSDTFIVPSIHVGVTVLSNSSNVVDDMTARLLTEIVQAVTRTS